jgi:catechol 2,3-dioxygenase-like lactoylglutathione lyase family enzyme
VSEQTATKTVTETPIEYANHLTISCGASDLDRAIEWYHDLLGFELIYKLDDMGWCELRTAWNGISIGLGQSEQPKVGGTTPVFGVKDIEAARNHLESNGVRFDGETQVIADMVKLATFYDPDGNPWMLAESNMPHTA